MSRLLAPVLALSLSLLACGGPPVAPEAPSNTAVSHPGPGPDAGFLEALAATWRHRLGRPADVQITVGGADILFLQSPARDFTRTLYRVDPQTSAVAPLLTAETLLGGADETLSPEERARRERLRLAAKGIARYQVARKARRVLVPLSGRVFVYDIAEARTYALPDHGPVEDARISPDGRHVALMRGGEVFVAEVSTGTEKQLTQGAGGEISFGTAEFVAQEEMDRQAGLWWSEDHPALIYQRTDTTGMERLHLGGATDPTEAPQATPYPRPGKTNAVVRLFLQRLEPASTPVIAPGPRGPKKGRRAAKALPKAPTDALPEAVEIRWDRQQFPYLAKVVWAGRAAPTVVVENRAQTELRVLQVNPVTGDTTVLLSETDPAWINLDPQMPRWLADGSGFLWTTERGGSWRLELRHADGTLANAVTPADFAYDGLARVDATTGAVWVYGTADSTTRNVFAIPLGGGQPVPIANEIGLNEVAARGDAEVAVHTLSPEKGPTRWHVRSLDRTQPTAPPRLGLPLAEIASKAEAVGFEVKPTWHAVTADRRLLRAQVILPRGHVAGWKYPVILAVYGGPHARVVRRHAEGYAFDQWLADHGFAVVRIDGRGTPGRGREWERAIHHDLATAPLSDQVAGLKALAALEPALDVSRVGVFGWSFGGYLSALAALRRPDAIQAAVAGAPVTDWLDYDTHYTERYLGVPTGDAGLAVYRQSSIIDDAPRLKRPLLIIHGTADDNVWFSHSLKLSNALLQANKPHDFLPLMGHAHMVSDVDVNRGLHRRITDFFVQHLGRPTAP